MYLGYNTNGFAFHPWPLALELIADLGYKAVGLTIDYHLLNPYADNFKSELTLVKKTLHKHNLKCVIETGSRFLLNPQRKHQPTLLTDDVNARSIRSDFLKHCLQIANELEAQALSFWSGAVDKNSCAGRALLLDQLKNEIELILKYSEKYQVPLAFEPEPGMFIATMAEFDELSSYFNTPLFGLTLDIGHLQCLETDPIPEIIQRYQKQILNIHIEDMQHGIHEHLMFGEGEIDFTAVINALCDINYQHGVYVELSRHSHNAYETATNSINFLLEKISTHKH
jgi:sugar phosphate isomerase/epimerase